MYTLSVEKVISTAHQLRDYDGPCARIHGHNWRVSLEVQSEEVDKFGIAIDFTDLDKKLWEVISPFDHQMINSVPPFDKINPTAENLVKFIYDQLKTKMINKVSLKKVSIWETDEYMVSYEE
jgi:6-pyruvoyltetrahydropterin/6-carboxytetrahydropterin synthase